MARPPKYKDVKSLEKKIEEYFTVDDIPTVPGLAYHLGFDSRQAIWHLKQKDKFRYTIKRALMQIESKRNKALVAKGANVAGLIFDLVNNFGWENKQRQEVSGPKGGPIEHTGLTNLETATRLAHLIEKSTERKNADSSAED